MLRPSAVAISKVRARPFRLTHYRLGQLIAFELT
jgi:hypothetical protein